MEKYQVVAMEKGITLLILAIIAGGLYAFNAWIDVSHWIQSGFDMASHNPIALPLSWITWGIFAYTTWVRGFDAGSAIYWFMAVIWFGTNLYFSQGMINYWFGV